MLDQRRRRWTTIKSTLDPCLCHTLTKFNETEYKQSKPSNTFLGSLRQHNLQLKVVIEQL